MARVQSDANVHPSWDDYPELLEELDLSKNNDLTFRGKPYIVFELKCGTNKKLDWKCSTCEHEWRVSGATRMRGSNCPACVNQAIHIDGRNSMAKTHPYLAKEYQGDATKIISGTGGKIDWKCSTCEHEWKALGSSRVNGSGCPYCNRGNLHSDGRNSMAKTHPYLAKEYQGDAKKIIAGTSRKIDWKCSTCEHEWKANGENRVQRGGGCPACSNYTIHSDGLNSMAKTHPDLAKEYQGDATKMIASTNKKLEWKCIICAHEWKANGANRIKGHGCPFCAGQTVHIDSHNSMANTHPELANEYQGDASIIIAGTNKKLDWKCSRCECEWKTGGNHRVSGTGCPACAEYGYNPSLVGYLYIHNYNDGINNWLKCGITNYPSDRIDTLKWSAKKLNIEVTEFEIYQFDDGFNARMCESELLSMKDLRFQPGYDVDGKAEFFKYESLEEIKKFILNWL
jgi:Zn finger protein HypA/HybF involved in hydrogenase expression